jgi:hypothetical protein
MPAIKESYICDSCGREFSKKFALTNHQKICIKSSKNNSKNNGTPKQPLTTTDRNAFKTLIAERANTILKALDDELDGKPETLINTLRLNKGLMYSTDQLNDLIKSTNEQIKAEIESHISHEKKKIDVEIADLIEIYDEKETDMKERHRKEWSALIDEKRTKVDELKQKQKTLTEEITKNKCGHLLEQKTDYQRKLVYTRQEEMKLDAEVKHRITMVTQCRGRLRHIINDAKNRSMETLWTTESREEAQSLIGSIPTVSEALSLLQQKDGIDQLIKRINPNMQLPRPKDMPQNIKDVKIEDDEDDEENEEDNDNDNEDNEEDNHDEIYEESEEDRRRIRTRARTITGDTTN